VILANEAIDSIVAEETLNKIRAGSKSKYEIRRLVLLATGDPDEADKVFSDIWIQEQLQGMKNEQPGVS